MKFAKRRKKREGKVPGKKVIVSSRSPNSSWRKQEATCIPPTPLFLLSPFSLLASRVPLMQSEALPSSRPKSPTPPLRPFFTHAPSYPTLHPTSFVSHAAAAAQDMWIIHAQFLRKWAQKGKEQPKTICGSGCCCDPIRYGHLCQPENCEKSDDISAYKE